MEGCAGQRLSKAWQKPCSEADSAVAMEIVPLGDSALIVRVDDSLGAVLATMRKLEAANISGVSDIAPAFASVALFLESPENLEACQRGDWCCLAEKKTRFREQRPNRAWSRYRSVTTWNSPSISNRSRNIAAFRLTTSWHVMRLPDTTCAASGLHLGFHFWGACPRSSPHRAGSHRAPPFPPDRLGSAARRPAFIRSARPAAGTLSGGHRFGFSM